jgi:hypothetical protein
MSKHRLKSALALTAAPLSNSLGTLWMAFPLPITEQNNNAEEVEPELHPVPLWYYLILGVFSIGDLEQNKAVPKPFSFSF